MDNTKRSNTYGFPLIKYWKPDLLRLYNVTPGDRLNIKMSSYQYRDSHYKDKMVHDRLIFMMEILIPERQGLL